MDENHYPLHNIFLKNYKAWFPPASFGIQEIHRPISMFYYILKRYLLETKELRHSDGGFFISFKPPHHAVTSATIET